MNVLLKLVLILDNIISPLIKLCKGATIFCVLSIAIIVSLSVFFRYVLNNSLTWSEEISKYLMVWMVFVGAPIAMLESRHIAIEILPNLFKPKLRAFIFLCVNVLIVITMGFWAVKGIEYTIGGWSQVISSFDWVPLGVVFASIPFGSSIMVLISFQIVLHQILVIYDQEKFNEFRIKTAKDRGVEE